MYTPLGFKNVSLKNYSHESESLKTLSRLLCVLPFVSLGTEEGRCSFFGKQVSELSAAVLHRT